MPAPTTDKKKESPHVGDSFLLAHAQEAMLGAIPLRAAFNDFSLKYALSPLVKVTFN